MEAAPGMSGKQCDPGEEQEMQVLQWVGVDAPAVHAVAISPTSPGKVSARLLRAVRAGQG